MACTPSASWSGPTRTPVEFSKAWPKDSDVARLHCELGLGLKLPPENRVRRCRRAAVLDPKNARPLLIASAALIAQRDAEGATAALLDAEKLVAQRPSEALWTWIATQHLELRNLSLAERAAANAPLHQASAEVETSSRSLRTWLGLPRDGRVPQAREREYLAAMDAAIHAAAEHQFKTALVQASRLARAFPEAPGPSLIRCHVVARQKAPVGQLVNACKRAVDAWDEAVFPVLALGSYAAAINQTAEARQRFNRAIALSPAWDAPYVSLYELHRKSGDKAEQEKVREAFRKQFGRELKQRGIER